MSRMTLGIVLAFAIPSISLGADPDCEKVLKYGRLKSTVSRNYARMDIFYSAFCTEAIKTEAQARQRADDIGFGYAGFSLSYAGKSRSSQTSEYFNAVCSAVKSGTYVQDDQLTVIETFSTAVAQSYETCISRTGLRLWSETDPDRRELVFFSARFNPDGAQPTPKVRDVKWLPKDAFSACQGPNRNDALQPNSVQTFQCSVSPAFVGREVALSLRTSTFGTKTVRAVLAPVPPPLAVGPVPAASAPVAAAPPRVDTKDFPSLLRYENSKAVASAVLGQWLEIDQGDPKNKLVPEFGLMIVDKNAGFEPSERLSLKWTLIVNRHHKPAEWSTETVEDVRIERGDAIRIARFPGYTDQIRGDGLPVLTTRVKLEVNGTGLKTLGVQARMTGTCATSTATALPGGSAFLDVRKQWGLGPCKLEIRLCSTKESRLYRPEESCG